MRWIATALALLALPVVTLVPAAPAVWPAPSQAQLDTALSATAVDSPNVTLSARPLRARAAAADAPLFSRYEGGRVGIPLANILSPDDFQPPHWNGRGLATGDIDRDGYSDIAFATEDGPRLYRNIEGRRFEPITVDNPAFDIGDVFIVSLADLNNDGWLDLFFTAYQQGNRVIYSDQGRFDQQPALELPAASAMLTKSAALGDLDRDGRLDIVLGNWFFGYQKHHPPKTADNYLLFNRPHGYQPVYLPGIAGETLSLLASDYNGDGALDLAIGNDFDPPDHFYLGDGSGGFRQVTLQDGIIPTSTNTTMSLDSADIDNDLDLDLYAAQIAARANGPAARMAVQAWRAYCNEIEDAAIKADCSEAIRQRGLFHFGSSHRPSAIRGCRSIDDPAGRRACEAQMIQITAIQRKDKPLCSRIKLARSRRTCEGYFEPSKEATPKQLRQAIPALPNVNALLINDHGRFTEQAAKYGIDSTGWSWSARFADFDNDGWQDLFVLNGTWVRGPGTPQKFFYRNLKGRGFEEVSDQIGVQSHLIQSAFSQFDADNDGDLDLIANSINGPVYLYRNNDQAGHAIQFRFDDRVGNRSGIGNKVIIHTADGGHQLRELKLGGGFQSFDAAVLHFGLGEQTQVERIEVHWSSGEKTTIEGPLPADVRYLITRMADPDVARSEKLPRDH